ncbi:MAG: ABC transporter permease subunit [Candidatus Rokubacteria bacterium]|nr:ABC transporter permease subunit [Candidatus Rokubacteria bacterium]
MRQIRVLVADDEKNLRELLTRELARKGHQVDSAADGLEALEQLRETAYVDAARAMGARMPRVLFIHIAPNTLGLVMVQATFTLASAILAEASLSFLGAGTPEFIPSWGNIVGTGQGYVQVAFWIAFFPGLFLTVTVLAVVLIGDALRDYLDPKLRGRIEREQA